MNRADAGLEVQWFEASRDTAIKKSRNLSDARSTGMKLPYTLENVKPIVSRFMRAFLVVDDMAEWSVFWRSVISVGKPW